MSSVIGGYAKREAFTGAMARQFAKADGKTTINDMVTNAVVEMKENEEEGYNQTPEIRYRKISYFHQSISNQTPYRAMVFNPRKNW